jgi:hypothetical protein
MKKDKVLFVSIALPPKNDPECIQSGRYIYFLNKTKKWDITAVTSAVPTLFMPFDESLQFYTQKLARKIEIKIPENKYVNYLIRKLNPNLLEKPDSKMLFHWQWRQVVKKCDKPDLIYSRSFPLSSSIMAYRLKEYYEIPWVMHLSDPWVESPLSNHKKSRYHKEWEKRCFESANLITFTNHRSLELYSEKYPNLQSKLRVSPNVYDPTDLAKFDFTEKETENNKIRITYTGGLANTRSAKVFLEAIKILKDQIGPKAEKLEIVFAGDMDSDNKKLFEKNNLEFIRHIGLLSNSEAQVLQLESDILLIIDSRIENKKQNVFFPSKLLDYMIKRKFILGITEDNSPTNEFIKSTNGKCFNFEQKELLAKWLAGIIDNDQLINQKNIINDYYSAEHQAYNLSELFSSLIMKQ